MCIRSRTAKTSIALCNRKLRILSPLSSQHQLASISSLLSILTFNSRLSTSSSLPRSSSKTTRSDSQSLSFSGIAQSVISRCPDLFSDKEDDKGIASRKDLLLEISEIVPEITRRFRRLPELTPQNVSEILVSFESECEKAGFRTRKVECLWELFKYANGPSQNKGFKHLPDLWKVMARILVRAGLFREFEMLAFEMDSDRIWLSCGEIFSDLIEGYVAIGDLNRAISMYDRMRKRGSAPSLSCFCVLLGSLVRKRKNQVAYRVCVDMAEIGVGSNDAAKTVLDGVVKLLREDRKVQEARNLVKKVVASGSDVHSSCLNEIVYGYCEKGDFDDVLSFFREIKLVPSNRAGNRIIHSLCSVYGSESAQSFMEELEGLGFVPDEITFGILIGWCCKEGKLRSSFAYIAEIYSRGLNPPINSYNSLASGLFLKSSWKHARAIFDEMVEKGKTPDSSTFRILLAGYCKAREFEEVKKTVLEMENHGLLQDVPYQDWLHRAFSVMGFDPLAMRIKRDNDTDFSRPDFFDDLGNGLYLDTDMKECMRMVTGILEDSLVPDYNSLVMKECSDGNVKAGLTLADEMVDWGQELSFQVFSVLLKRLCSTRLPLKVYENLIEENMKFLNLLDEEALNLLVQVYCKRGWTYKGKVVLDGMLQRCLKIENETYTNVIIGLCKTGNLMDFHRFWEIALKEKWVPRIENAPALLQCLCKSGILKQALELLEKLVAFPHLRLDICHLFFEKLSLLNSTRLVCILMEEFTKRGFVIDRVAYGHIIRGMFEKREFSEALKVLDFMIAKNIAPPFDAIITLIPELCKANRHEEAFALKEMSFRENPFSLLSTSNALINGFCMTKNVGEAISVLQEMPLKGINPNAESYGFLIQGFSKVNNLTKVREILGVVIRKDYELSILTYRNLVLLMSTEGNVHRALKLKELMLGRGESHDLIVINILIFRLFSNGNGLFVKEVLDDLRKKIVQLDEVSYNFLVYGFSKCRDASSAFDYLSAMITKQLMPSKRSLRAAIVALCDSKELGKALTLSREMVSRGWFHDSIVQNAIVEGLLSQSKLEEAEIFLDRLVEKQLVPDNINYDNLIKQFCSLGRTKKAVDLLNVMLKKGNVPNSTSYESIIMACCASNKLNKAMDFHVEMLDRNIRQSIATWNVLVRWFCLNGQTEEAERILISMADIGESPTKEMFSGVIDRYRVENNPKKASELVEMMQRSGFEPDFEMHWSVISNLRSSIPKANEGKGQGLLSSLLSQSGFFRRSNSKTK